MKILVLNLTRMGDIIQTSALINGLQKRHKNAIIDCLTMSSFASILHNFPNINNIYTLDDKILVDNLQDNFLEAYLEIQQKINLLNQQNYDMIINLVISSQSSYLTYLLKAPDKRGMLFTKERNQKIDSDWTAYHLANEHHLGDHSLNLVDIFNGMGDVAPDFSNFSLSPSKEAIEFANDFWLDNNLTNKQVIGFHIGASNSNKAWEVDKFKTVISSLIKEYKVILFGGYKEIEFAEHFQDINSENFIIQIGKTNLDKLIALMSKLDLLVSNDTGPMHIATSQKIPIIDISLGPVSHWETSPYIDNAIILQANISCHPCKFNDVCSHLKCHNYINTDAVLQAIFFKLGEINRIENNPKINYWKTQSDPFNFQHCVPLNIRPISKRELLFEFKRLVWIITLQDKLDQTSTVIADYVKYLNNFYSIEHFDFTDNVSSLQTCSELVSQYLDNIQNLNNSDKKSERNNMASIWTESKKILLKATSIANKTNFITDFFSFATFKISGIESTELEYLVKQNYIIYSNLHQQLTLLIKLFTEKK